MVLTKKDANASTTEPSNLKRRFQHIMGQLGRIGKALLFPIAIMPVAAILLRVGSQLPSGSDVSGFAHFVQQIIVQAGSTVFDNLPLIFAVGVGFGLTRDNRGEAALAATVGMLLLKLLMSSNGADLPKQIWGNTSVDFHDLFGSKYDAIMANNVLNGIICGAIVAFLYNRFNGVELPKILGFFSGRRLIPVLSVLGIIFFGIFYAIVFPWIGYVLAKFSDALTDATGNRWANASIMFIYVLFNRLLIPFGLHHIPNTLFWFQFGTHVDANGLEVRGDINIFLSGIPEGNHAGTFQSGFFPMMMFGLPALVAAIWVTAENKEQRTRVLALLGGSALVSFLTGITEPIEFAFLFAAPALFVMHALLGGFFAFITGVFGIQLGFGFSAGLFDYLLSIPKSIDIINANYSGVEAAMANPGWLVPIGLVTAAAYFFAGKFLIKKLNLSTPGRGEALLTGGNDENKNATPEPVKGANGQHLSQTQIRALKIVGALGGFGNITNYQNCAVRLRYDLKNSDVVDEKALKEAGAIGVIKVSKTHVQVVIGPAVEGLNNAIIEMRDASVIAHDEPAKEEQPAQQAS